ncbi:MAG: ABC transporter ATP-binding protein [Gammaproteobacteria bacterium]|nr:ABC transporter ATP-binding protein [Gammaproteobacteria bacterium]MBU1442619.1 ABC transporter ATP-binding protein [Gammaproteobacteria bacterium]MBU2409148.1 ABC transporter ATP-binding protein [Gammaproteobacteria bacterium]
MSLLQVDNLHIQLQTQRGPAEAVRGISFALERGDTLGIVGESGCGKSVTVQALMGLLPANAKLSGSIRFDGTELIGLPERNYREIRGNRIGMIFQEPMTALNPVHTIARQVGEPLRLHRGLSAAEARKAALALLKRVGIPDASSRLDAYPHQFSGGQRQRIGIAMALACEPDLLIADEPTTALDVTIQKQILDLIQDLVAERGMALILISHDLGVIARSASKMLVMYGGSIVESGPTTVVFSERTHPYTQGLFAARPQLNGERGQKLATIRGSVPDLVDLPPGCPFAGRCRYTVEACHATRPAITLLPRDHEVRCIQLDEISALEKGS